MRYNNIALEVLIKGRPITEYPHNGKTFIEGRAGSAFEVRVTNHNDFRVEAVISVDGLSVTDGKDAGPNSTGYVLDAGQSAVIPGWKLSAEQVAAFEFAGKSNSYAGHATGSTRNTGVIGVMAFKDRYDVGRVRALQSGGLTYGLPGMGQFAQPNLGLCLTGDASHLHALTSVGLCGTTTNLNNTAVVGSGGNGIGDMGWASSMAVGSASTFATAGTPTINAMCMNAAVPDAGWETFGSPDSAPGGAPRGRLRTMGASAKGATRRVQAQAETPAPVQQNLGTAFGKAQEFATTTVNFHRGDLTAMITLFYDDARGLKQRGVVLDRRSKNVATQTPNAFPGMGCSPPPGWRG